MIKICLHHLELKTKSEATKNVGMITNQLANCVTDISFPDFINEVGKGKTWSGATFEPKIKKAKYWNQQSVFAIDVDNNDGDNISPMELAQHYTRLGFPPNGLYYSLSSTPEQQKYRLIWFTSQPITCPKIAKNFNRWLIMNSKNYADSCTINLDRLFFGGKNSHHLFEEPIPYEMVPQYEIKKKEKKAPEYTSKQQISNFDRVMVRKLFQRNMSDPQKYYGTRYKTIFNTSVSAFKITNGLMSVDDVFSYVCEFMEAFPNQWSDYHYDTDDVYKWCERAYQWTTEEVLNG